MKWSEIYRQINYKCYESFADKNVAHARKRSLKMERSLNIMGLIPPGNPAMSSQNALP